MSGSIFQVLAKIFKKHSVAPVLSGGYAVIAYKIQRMTFDIDFMITMDDFLKIESDIRLLGYTEFNRKDAFVQLKTEVPGLRDLDFLISDKNTVDGLIAEGKKIFIAGEEFVIPSLIHLITMKLHAISGNETRELKDFPDIVQLLMTNNIDPRSDRIKRLFNKYHASEQYEKIIEMFKKRDKQQGA